MRREGPILVVSASAGTGHLRAGAAVRDACRAHGLDAEHVDVLELAPRWLKAAYAGGFELLARLARATRPFAVSGRQPELRERLPARLAGTGHGLLPER
jgi:hypothetical protein